MLSCNYALHTCNHINRYWYCTTTISLASLKMGKILSSRAGKGTYGAWKNGVCRWVYSIIIIIVCKYWPCQGFPFLLARHMIAITILHACCGLVPQSLSRRPPPLLLPGVLVYIQFNPRHGTVVVLLCVCVYYHASCNIPG